MDAVFSFFKGIVDLGAAVMLPIVLIIIGLFFRMKLGQAIKSGLMVGIGFQGLCLVVNLLTTSIQPVIKYYQTMGSGFTTTDLGFAAVALKGSSELCGRISRGARDRPGANRGRGT